MIMNKLETMTVPRPKADANGQLIRERQTELSDVIRARNKIQDRLLNVKLKYFEKEKDIRLNMIQRERKQLERVRASIVDEARDIVMKRQSVVEIPVQPIRPEMIFPEWQIDPEFVENNPVPPPLTMNLVRRHSTR